MGLYTKFSQTASKKASIELAEATAKAASKRALSEVAEATLKKATTTAAKTAATTASKKAILELAEAEAEVVVKRAAKESIKKGSNIGKKVIAAAAVTGVGIVAYSAYDKFNEKNNATLTIIKITQKEKGLITIKFNNPTNIQLIKDDIITIINSDSEPKIDDSYNLPTQNNSSSSSNSEVTFNSEVIITKDGTQGTFTIDCDYDNQIFNDTGKDISNLGSGLLDPFKDLFDKAGLNTDYVMYFLYGFGIVIFLSIIFKLYKILKSN